MFLRKVSPLLQKIYPPRTLSTNRSFQIALHSLPTITYLIKIFQVHEKNYVFVDSERRGGSKCAEWGPSTVEKYATWRLNKCAW